MIKVGKKIFYYNNSLRNDSLGADDIIEKLIISMANRITVVIKFNEEGIKYLITKL